MKSFDELLVSEAQRIARAGGLRCLLETDCWINQYSRALIRAMRRDKGICYLLSANSVKLYKRGMVHNFEFQFITYDDRLAGDFMKALVEGVPLPRKILNSDKVFALLWK